MKKRKKVFRTQRVKTFKAIDRLAWIVPIFILWLLYHGSNIGMMDVAAEIGGVFENSFFAGMIYIVLMLFCIAMLCAPIMLIWKAVTHALKKSAIQNATFNVLEDFDYYRDKLTGISPADISMLTDLEIEQKKDITALILKYMMLDVVIIENGVILVKNIEHPDLLESDRFLLNSIASKGFNSSVSARWMQMAKAETVQKGYLIDIRQNRKSYSNNILNGCLTSLLTGCVTPIIIWFAIGLFVIFGYMDTMEQTLEWMESIEESMEEDTSEMEALVNMTSSPDKVFQMFTIMILGMVMFGSFLLPLISFIRYITKIVSSKVYKRSVLGEELTEQIYGMKNFIHDFSDLSNANKEQLVLWDDFLIYAVVLEENTSIVNEICGMKHIDITKVHESVQSFDSCGQRA